MTFVCLLLQGFLSLFLLSNQSSGRSWHFTKIGFSDPRKSGHWQIFPNPSLCHLDLDMDKIWAKNWRKNLAKKSDKNLDMGEEFGLTGGTNLDIAERAHEISAKFCPLPILGPLPNSFRISPAFNFYDIQICPTRESEFFAHIQILSEFFPNCVRISSTSKFHRLSISQLGLTCHFFGALTR